MSLRLPIVRGKAINRDPDGNYRTDHKNGDWVYGIISDYWTHDEREHVELTNKDGISGIEVDPKTIGWYTYREDSEENEIFEGDIVVCPNGDRDEDSSRVGVITFVNGHLVPCIHEPGVGWYYLLVDCYIEKVIGNIWDNPDMVEEFKLKVKK